MPHHRRRHAHAHSRLRKKCCDRSGSNAHVVLRPRPWTARRTLVLHRSPYPPTIQRTGRAECHAHRRTCSAQRWRAASARRPLAPMALDASARTPCADSLAQRHLIRQWIGRDPRRPAGTKERGPGSSSEEKLRHGHVKPRLWSGTKLGGRGISGNTRSWLLRCGALVI
jgi:hypothetical protein